ncbi:hypothetical protein B0H13DRAFT_2464717 [Mycena leptocephala]|nr:hypothetical protein B0H13DRAFT_2464717 [Mycena leptocephala]
MRFGCGCECAGGGPASAQDVGDVGDAWGEMRRGRTGNWQCTHVYPSRHAALPIHASPMMTWRAFLLPSICPSLSLLFLLRPPCRIDGLPSSSSHSYGTVAYPALTQHMSSHQHTQGKHFQCISPPAVLAFAVPPGVTPAFPLYAQEQRQGPGQGQGQAQAQDAGNFAGVSAQMALGAAWAVAVALMMGNVGYSTPFSLPVGACVARADVAAQARAWDLEAVRDAERVAREVEAQEREEDAEKEWGKAQVADGAAPACDAAEVLGDREWEYGETAQHQMPVL